MYSSNEKCFFVKVSSFAQEIISFADILLADSKSIKEEFGGLARISLKHIAYQPLIIANDESTLKRMVTNFLKYYLENIAVDEKIILYKLKFHTADGKSSNDYHSENDTYIEFEHITCNKKTIGTISAYIRVGSNRSMYDYIVKEYKQIPWTQELEDLMNNIDKAFSELIDKLIPYFKEEGRISELIGKNIISNQ